MSEICFPLLTYILFQQEVGEGYISKGLFFQKDFPLCHSRAKPGNNRRNYMEMSQIFKMCVQLHMHVKSLFCHL